MPISLDALIRRTQLAIDAENDPRKLRSLQASLAAHLSTKAEMDDDDDDDDDKKDKDDDDDGDESKSKKAAAAAAKAKGKAESAKHKAKAAEYRAKAAESEEAAKAAEESDEEDSEASSAIVSGAAPADHSALLAKLAASVAEIKQTQLSSTKASLITGARKLGAITKSEATWLADLSVAHVESFLELRAKAGLVVTSEDGLVKPKHVPPGSAESLPAETVALIEAAVAEFPGDKVKFRDQLVKANTKVAAEALNGAGGRY